MGWYNNEGQLRVEGGHPAKSVLLSWSAPLRDLPTTHNTTLHCELLQSNALLKLNFDEPCTVLDLRCNDNG